MSKLKAAKRVLIVDPDIDHAETCRATLATDPFANYELDQVGTATQAKQQAAAVGYDCVIISDELPDQPGMDMVRYVSTIEMAKRPASIFMTREERARIAVECIKNGAQDYISVANLAEKNFPGMVRAAIEEQLLNRQLFVEQKKLEHLALHDPLTNLANRSLFTDRLEHSLERAKRKQSNFAVVMIDLDGFKQVNDTYGHDAGDAVLVEMGERFNHCLRQTDTLARLGGDEFAILLEGITATADTYHVLKRLLKSDDTPVTFNGAELKIGMSIGFAVYPDTAETVESLMHTADQAMYIAKRNGGGCARPDNFPAPAATMQLTEQVYAA